MNGRRRPPVLASQSGFAILEVIVSATVLAIVSMAVLAGIDGASSSTGRERARSIAANLAEQDQERMRSMQIDSLADFVETREVKVDGATYEVASNGKWVRDDTGGTISCQNNSSQADYLQISSNVKAKGGKGKPVAIESLVAPSVAYSSTRGSLAVQVNDRNGAGIPGLAVNITGPSSDSATTNDQGCAIFQYLVVGNYNILLNRPGYVNHFGEQSAVGNQDVTAGTLNVRSIDYDRAATATATIGTYRPGALDASAPNLKPSRALHVSLTNGGEPGMQRVWSQAAPAGSVLLDQLFPFKSPYGVFTGKCDEANPVVYPGNANYFPSYTGSVQTDPGGTHAVTVRQPPLNIRVRDRNGAYISSLATRQVRVFATLRTNTAECTEPAYKLYAMGNPDEPSGSRDGWPSHTRLGVAGALLNLPDTWDPGLPFGVYDLCFDYQNSAGSSNWRTFNLLGYDNTQPLGRPGAPLPVPTSVTGTGGAGQWSASGSAVPANKCAP